MLKVWIRNLSWNMLVSSLPASSFYLVAVDAAAWDANLAELNMLFGKSNKKIKNIASQIN